MMLKSNLVLWYRRMMRRKAFAAINLAGLSISLVGSLLIYLYVSHEVGYDQFHSKADRIFRVYCAYAKPGESVEKFPYTPPVLAPAARSEIKELEEYTRVFEMYGNVILQNEDKVFNETQVYRVDSGFFKVFTGRFLVGNAASCLKAPLSVVLSRTAAVKYFGSVPNSLNRTLRIKSHFDDEYIVTAVVDDFPSNSHLNFSALLSNDYGKENFHPDNWLSHDPLTYVLLQKMSGKEMVEEHMRKMTERILDPIYMDRYGKTYQEQKQAGGLQEYRLQPLKEVHLHSADMGGGGGIRNVYIFSSIGVMLILLACFNYVNISTARSAWDAKGAGIRKVLGSTRRQLYSIFLTESVGVSLVSTLIAIAAAQVLLGSGSSFLHSFVPYDGLPVKACLLLLCTGLTIGLLSGIVPAKLISSFEPRQVIKGQVGKGKVGNSLRQILVVAQFIVSMGLIMCTFIISGQLNFMQEMSLGFNKEHLLVIENVDKLGDRMATLKEIVNNESVVANASLCYGAVGSPSNSAAFTPVELLEQGREDIVIGIPLYIGDEDYLKTLGIKLVMGQAFPAGLAREDQQIILNEEALRSIGWKDRDEDEVIGKMIDVNGLRYKLAGIVEDYHFESLHRRMRPMAILSHYYQGYEQLMLRIRPGTTQQAVEAARKHWNAVAPDLPFQYSFVEDDLTKLYTSEQNLGWLFKSFASLAIFIACLGLVGLAMFSAESRVKEIGIRKVLGASVRSILLTLSGNMVMLIGFAFVLATPVSWYLMKRWLENFAYRIEVSVWSFILAGAITMCLALLTMSYQSLRAALLNPVHSLRYE